MLGQSPENTRIPCSKLITNVVFIELNLRWQYKSSTMYFNNSQLNKDNREDNRKDNREINSRLILGFDI